jgi:hypothetical protein
MKHPEFVVSVLLAIATVFVIAIWVPGKPDDKIKLTLEYGMLILLFLFGFLILVAIASGKIDISTLLTEHGGGASMSRFQLLIFTFVIGLSFFLVVVCGCKIPDVPADVLALLGISASTYGVSKGIQASGGLADKTAPAATGTTDTTKSTQDGKQDGTK